MNVFKLASGCEFPRIIVPKVGGGDIEFGMVSDVRADWHFIVIYRGKHCPACAKYLAQLSELKDSFTEIGLEVVAISGDTKEKAMLYRDTMNFAFDLGYDMTIEQMKSLGLYISIPRSDKETDRPFPEPALFVINEKKQAQIIDISSSPFARPNLRTVLSGIRWVRKTAYPIRGTYEY